MVRKNPTSKHSPDQDNKYLKYYGLAFELVVLNAGLIWGGYMLDDHLNSSPIIILAATFLAMAGTIWMLTNRLR